MNLMFFPVLILASLLSVVGYKLGMRPEGVSPLTVVAAIVGAVPGMLLALYYLHLFDDALWFYRFRSWPLTELTAAGAGFLAGLIQSWIVRKDRRLRTLVPGLLLAGLFIPYMKPVLSPLDRSTLTAACPDSVCLQTTPATCGPASVASILRLFDVEETEQTLAREAYTSSGGTENWYLARALRRRGFPVRYVVAERPVATLPVPSLAGVILPDGSGHFIAILGETDSTWVVGDPMYGRVHVSKARLSESYSFTGFFMIITPARG